MKTKLRLGLVGLGRLGKEYLNIITQNCRQAELVSVCSLIQTELDYAKKIGVINVYASYEEMLEKGNFDALLVLSPSDLHPQHIIQGLNAGYHIFSEKPLGITLESCLEVEQVKAKHPTKIVMISFVRRFDDSYLYAMEKIQSGVIGKPFYVRSQTVDHKSIAPFQLKFMSTAGSVYLDYNVHDIDLARWILKSEFVEVYSVGGAYKYKEFEKYNSVDNTMSSCKLENGTMAHILASRTCPHGHATATEIWATDGWLKIGYPANHIQVEWGNEQGSTREYVKTFFDRFKQAFQKQMQCFIACVLNGKQPKLQLRDATQATNIALAMQKSFDQQKLIKIKKLR